MACTYPLVLPKYVARCAAVAITLVLAVSPPAGRAQATPSASATPSTAPEAPHGAPPEMPHNFDPCGGPLELLNKIGNGTACVFVAGEAAAIAQYGSANIPVNSQISFRTSRINRSFSLSAAAHAFGLPASVIYVGVGPRSQFVFTPPSFVQIDATGGPRLTRNNPLVAGASDMKFEYKELLWFNPEKFTMVALDLAYKAPTGSPLLAGFPAYTLDPIATQPLPHGWGLTLAFPVNNSASQNAPTCVRMDRHIVCTPGAIQRGWGFSPQVVPYWQSHGGTLLALVVQHNFSPNATPVIFSLGQLFGRHFELALGYGGFNYSVSTTGPLNGLINASATAYPTLFSASANYLFGESNLPEEPQQ
jgi:hypothetical protein